MLFWCLLMCMAYAQVWLFRSTSCCGRYTPFMTFTAAPARLFKHCYMNSGSQGRKWVLMVRYCIQNSPCAALTLHDRFRSRLYIISICIYVPHSGSWPNTLPTNVTTYFALGGNARVRLCGISRCTVALVMKRSAAVSLAEDGIPMVKNVPGNP